MPLEMNQDKADFLSEALRRGALKGGKKRFAEEALRRSGYAEESPPKQASTPMTEDQREKMIFEKGEALGETYGPAKSALLNAGEGVFGLGSRAGAAVDYMTQEGDRPYDDFLAYRRGQAQGAYDENPVSGGAGYVGGMLVGSGGAGGVAARAAPRVAAALAPKAGQTLANVGRYTAAGAVEGGAQAAGEGEIGDAPVGAVGGAITGPAAAVAAPAVAGAARRIVRQPKISRTWRMLAKKLRTPVEDMSAFMDDYKTATGQTPSVAQVIQSRDQGLLKGWAARHNTLGDRFGKAAEEAPGDDLSAGRLRKARDDSMDAAMVPLRDTPVTIGDDLLGSPHVADAMAGPKMKDIRIKVAEGEPLTVGDVDRIRLKLRGMQKAEPGGPFGDFADQLREDTASQVPEYGEALERFSKDSKFLEGFEPARAGKTLPEVEDKVTTPEGRAGHEAGRLTRKGQRPLNTMAPTTPASEANVNPAARIKKGALHSAFGSLPFGLGQISQGLHNVVSRLPEKTQVELADGLLSRDTATVNATLGKIRKAGADLQDVRRLRMAISALSGQAAGGTVGRQSR